MRKACKELSCNAELFAKVDVAAQGGNSNLCDQLVSIQDLQAVAAFRRQVTLEASMAVEPRAIVTVQNQRTGTSAQATVGDDRQLRVGITDAQNGDPLYITLADNNQVQGKPFILTVETGAPNGLAGPPADAGDARRHRAREVAVAAVGFGRPGCCPPSACRSSISGSALPKRRASCSPASIASSLTRS